LYHDPILKCIAT